MTGSGDSLRWPDKLYTKLRFLASSIGQSDFPPTNQQLEVHQMFIKQLAEYKSRYNDLINKDLVAFNALLKEKNIPNIIAGTD